MSSSDEDLVVGYLYLKTRKASPRKQFGVLPDFASDFKKNPVKIKHSLEDLERVEGRTIKDTNNSGVVRASERQLSDGSKINSDSEKIKNESPKTPKEGTECPFASQPKIIKGARVRSLVYTNWKGISNDCNCRRKCYSRFSEDDREQIFSRLSSLETKDEQDHYLLSLIAIAKVQHRHRRKTHEESSKTGRSCSYIYRVSVQLGTVFVCKMAFINLHRITRDRVRRLCWLLVAGKSHIDMRGKSTPVEDCKKRWRSIRDTYNRQRKTLKKAARSSVKYRPSTWPLTSKLSFLNHVDQEKGLATKTIKMENNEFEEEETEIDLSYVDVNDGIANYDEGSRVSTLDDENPSSSLESHLRESSPRLNMSENFPSNPSAELKAPESGDPWGGTNNSSCKKRKLNEDVFGASESRVKGAQIKDRFTSEEFDSLETFFKSMSLTVKQLKPDMVAEAKLKICKIVTDLELKAIQLASRSISELSSKPILNIVSSESLRSNDLNESTNSNGMQLHVLEKGDSDVPNTLPQTDEDSEFKTPITQAHSVPVVSSRVLPNNSRYPEKEDEFDVVGRRVAYQLRGMETRQSLIAEKLVSDVMFQGRLGKLDEKSFLCLTQPT